MSHFVSSKGGEDFEELNQQLLRREPLDEEKEDAVEAIEAQEAADAPSELDNKVGASTSRPTSTYLRAGTSTEAEAPSSRPSTPRLRDLHPPSAANSPKLRSPSYSRRNSPERQERPRSPHPGRKSVWSIHGGLEEAEHGRDQAGAGLASSAASGSGSGGSSDGRTTPNKLVVESGGRIRRQKSELKSVAFSPEPELYQGPFAVPPDELNQRLFAREPLLSRSSSVVGRRNTGMIDQNEMIKKLGTWDGVFVPVSLNILGIILFLRFGFILGQAGFIGALTLLVISYAIDALTSTSISAISTNGVVRAGGIFYLASRSLGPEFGGATGLLFWLGQALNACLNALGFVETLMDAFGSSREGPGDWNGLPEGSWWSFLYGSFILLLSTVICLVGSRLFVRASLLLAVILAVSILSIPASTIFKMPYTDEARGVYYTGWSLTTFKSNLWPRFTTGAAGSSSPTTKENWASVFGVLFPAVTGVLAGASMSGDLRKPSKSIPKGTHWSLLCTFIVYAAVFLILAGTTARASFYQDAGVMGDISIMPSVITAGALASTAFSTLMGIQACGKVLQAIARDHLLPMLDYLAQGTEMADTPTYGIVTTYLFCQLILFVDSLNIIAQLVTMTSLLCFAVLSFACLALKAGGAPSFRPSFPYFSIYTAAAGATSSLVAMFFTDSTAASACILLAIILFGAIHVFSPPKPWGDVTRNIHYWLTRKYLLRLDERKTNLKHWRPQVLLLANNPRTEWNLIIFCNSLKKGGLYVLGHCIKGEFSECLSELRRQQIAWLKLVDLSGIKSFVDVIIADDERDGARSLILSAGLGGMRPNIVVLGFPRDLQAKARESSMTQMRKGASSGGKSDSSEITIRGPHVPPHMVARGGHRIEHLPTDATRKEAPITAQAYVGIIEDALSLNKAVAVAYGFDMMQLPGPSWTTRYEKSTDKQYIDLWPIQIASPDSDTEHAWDTYTMVLQLGTILSLTGTWKNHQLRVSVFVEEPAEVEAERKRVRSLLDNLRIPAMLRVFALADRSVVSYEAIVIGDRPAPPHIEEALRDDPWWNALKQLRREDEVRAKAAAAKRRSQLQQRQVSGSDIPSAAGNPSTSAADARRSKRELRNRGYALPPDHLEYFKRNIRIGLSHPRSKVLSDNDADAEEEEDSGSDSDGSGLSDELMRLGEDDFFASSFDARRQSVSSAMSTAGSRNAAFRGRAHSHGGHVTGLPDEPGFLGPPATPASSKDAYGSMSSTPVVRPDGTLARVAGSGKTPSARGSSPTGSVRGGRSDTQPKRHSHLSLGESFSEADLMNGNESTASSLRDTTASPADHTSRPASSASIGPSPTRPELTFNRLPNKAQFLILNELFRAHSSSSATSVILTSLPAPEPGTAKNADAVNRYLGQLESLCAGTTPVLGIHARELTLSMSL